MLLCGCEDEIKNGSGNDFSEGTIAVTIGGKNAGNTRAVTHTLTAPSNVINLSFKEGEQPLCLIETVTDLDEVTYDAVNSTRSTPAYTENFYDLYGSDLYGTAFKPQTGTAQLTDVWGSYLENGGTVNFKHVDGNTYAYDYSKGQTVNLSWPEGNKLLFFFQAPYTNTSVLNPKFYADGSIKFSYADPNTPNDNVITNGSEKQKDILFTSKTITEETKTSAHILLYHALASVKFKMGSFTDGGENVTNITKVELVDVYSAGDCTIKPNYADGTNTSEGNPSNKDGGDATKSFKCSTWTSQRDVVTYEQTLPDELYDGVDGEDGVDFPESFYAGNSAEKNYNDNTFSKTLQLVPQEKTIKVKIYYTFTIDGETSGEHCVETSMSVDWQAGKLYTYALSANELSVTITDEVSNNVKSGLATTNTANTIQYQRVALVANWYKVDEETDERLIVKTEFINGTGAEATYITIADFPGTNWASGSDGYYYYKSPIKPGQTPNAPLFSTYTVTRSGANVADDLELEMQVIVQAVRFDDNKEDKLSSVKASWTGVTIGSTNLDSWLSVTVEEPNGD